MKTGATMDNDPATGSNEKGSTKGNDTRKPGAPSQVTPAPERSTNEGEQAGEHGRVPCPRCAELIQPAAKACRYCGHEVQAQPAAQVDDSGGGNGEQASWPLPSMELAKVSINEFYAMSVALVKQRDEEKLTAHERRLIAHFFALQKEHGEEALKKVMADKMAERQYELLDKPTRALLEHYLQVIPERKEAWGKMSWPERMSYFDELVDECEVCGAKAPQLFEADVPEGRSMRGDIGQWRGKGSFNVGTTVKLTTKRVCLRCRDALNPPVKGGGGMKIGCLVLIAVVVLVVVILFVKGRADARAAQRSALLMSIEDEAKSGLLAGASPKRRDREWAEAVAAGRAKGEIVEAASGDGGRVRTYLLRYSAAGEEWHVIAIDATGERLSASCFPSAGDADSTFRVMVKMGKMSVE